MLFAKGNCQSENEIFSHYFSAVCIFSLINESTTCILSQREDKANKHTPTTEQKKICCN